MPLAASTDHGHNLQTVQLLIKKNQVKAGDSPSLLFVRVVCRVVFFFIVSVAHVLQGIQALGPVKGLETSVTI